MKKWYAVVILLVAVIFVAPAFAGTENGRTTFLNFDSDWDNLGVIDPITGNPYTDDMLNEYLRHDHGFEYWEMKNPVGGYVRGIFYQMKDENWGMPTLEGEYRYDGANDIHEFWLGCTIDFDAIRRGLLGW